jgi:hypothetical protein
LGRPIRRRGGPGDSYCFTISPRELVAGLLLERVPLRLWSRRRWVLRRRLKRVVPAFRRRHRLRVGRAWLGRGLRAGVVPWVIRRLLRHAATLRSLGISNRCLAEGQSPDREGIRLLGSNGVVYGLWGGRAAELASNTAAAPGGGSSLIDSSAGRHRRSTGGGSRPGLGQARRVRSD